MSPSVVVALDSFKGTISAADAVAELAAGWGSAGAVDAVLRPATGVVEVPVGIPGGRRG